MDADPHTAAPPLDHATIRSIVIGIMLAMFLAALDQTIVATAMPTIGRELHDLEHLPWVASAYLLSATAVTPLYGKLSDIPAGAASSSLVLASSSSGLLPARLPPRCSS